MLVNGVSGSQISIRDRGLLYGDGVFRTLRVCGGQALHWPQHYDRLRRDCEALGFACPAFDGLTAELGGLLGSHPEAVFKIIVTRGLSDRGYAPPKNAVVTHIWDVAPVPVYPEGRETRGVALQLCSLRLAMQPLLAGIKHLNRLESVLAAAELDAGMAEGLLLDGEGRVIEGTRSNVFMIVQGRLVTPDLSRCGVAGVQRDRIIAYAEKTGVPVDVRDVALEELCASDALFLTNSVFGLWPVAQFEQYRWTDFSFVGQLRTALEGR